MSEPFLGEIKLVAFNFAPRGWAVCNGQLLPINQNQALFALLGTMYGGNGQTTFALPNLIGRVAIHVGNGYTQGESAGVEAVTLSASHLPTHTHAMRASSGNAVAADPSNAYLASPSASLGPVYAAPDALVATNPGSIGNTGGGQAHNNMQPFLALCYAIALQGIFPSQN